MSAKALDIKNLPTPKEERWKYTNLPRAIPQGLRLITDTPQKVIHISRGEVCEQLEDILWTGVAGQHLQPSLKITLEENAELHIIESHTGQGAYWKNMITEITLAANAKLIHYRLQDDTPEAVHTNMAHITLARDAQYQCVSLNTGAALSRHQVHVELQGENAYCALSGINLLRNSQLGDTTIVIEHQAPHCASHQNYRSVIDGQATGVFQGKVHVHQIAQKTDGYQKSDTLLLSEGAQMNTKPELEIYADDVKCSHGTTTGKLDETPLFYLCSRGIPEAEARALLIKCFVGQVVDEIVHKTVQNDIHEKIDQWLRSSI